MPNDQAVQTHEMSETVAFRCLPHRRLLYMAVATRRGEFLSDFLRKAADSALARELVPESTGSGEGEGRQ